MAITIILGLLIQRRKKTTNTISLVITPDLDVYLVIMIANVLRIGPIPGVHLLTIAKESIQKRERVAMKESDVDPEVPLKQNTRSILLVTDRAGLGRIQDQ